MLNALFTTFIATASKFFFLLIGALGLVFLIAFHELGHFLFAKLFQVRVPSFSIGFGPKIFSKKIGDTEFSLSALPLGGYVEMAGSAEIGQGDQKEAYATDKGSFATKPFYQKLCILSGGIIFNLFFAYCAMILLFMVGIPKNRLLNTVPVIAVIEKNSLAEKHDLQGGDRIIAVQNQPIENNITRMKELLILANTPISLTIERNGTHKTLSIPLENTDQSSPLDKLGILAFDTEPTPSHSLPEAIKKGIATTNQFIKMTFASFSILFSKKGVQQVTGPIGIIAMTVHAASTGITIFLLLLALISINLAILNLIPLPIVDGGQILFYTIEALIGRSMPEKIREYIHIATWILFLMLFIYLSGKDIYNLISPYITTLRSLLGFK